MKLKNKFYNYLSNNKMIFIAVFTVFFIGVICGGYISTCVSPEEIDEIKMFSGKYFSTFTLSSVNKKVVFEKIFLDSFKIVTLMWLSGIIPVLIPVSLVQIFFSGLKNGFLFSFFAGVYHLKGIIFFLLSCFMNIIIILPLIIFYIVYNIKYSFKKNSSVKKRLLSTKNFLLYAGCILSVTILSMFESFIMLLFTKLAIMLNII